MLHKKAFFAGIVAIAVGVTIVMWPSETIAPAEVAPTPITVREEPFVGPRTKSDARAALAALPEIKAWSEHLETSSGGTAKGVEGAPPAPIVDANQTYFEFQVEKPVVALNNASPVFPSMLQNQGVSGQVIAQFVVDTTGRVDVSTFKVVESSHDLFTAAVKNSLPRMRFQPAEVGGRKVKQLVQQPFVFNIGK